ncbi:uncharacterized protein LOC129971089 isoform X2 [Argiope bruennichi]|uniref:uncharacterized protein LOC129971089 isoform X2 n=1 Tax=Argiope bruennichi TaxID=94029 RepID=UPI002494A423|nr:uncharacterized protein LOC129971089 isoform X2 [Argiope bruennichi]
MNGERTFTKRNFMEFVHRVTPIQNFFLQEGCEADNDVLQVLFELQMDLAEGMIDGACAFAQHTGREQVVEEDLLNYLDTCWKLDPLLISEKFYRVEEAVKDDIHFYRTIQILEWNYPVTIQSRNQFLVYSPGLL